MCYFTREPRQAKKSFMAIQVTVGPPLITINRGNTFVLSEPDGSLTPYTDQGFYCRDTRYVSNYQFYADRERWLLQNSGAIAYSPHGHPSLIRASGLSTAKSKS